MNERRYRAALLGVFAAVLLCGVMMFIRYGKEQKIPAEATLVKNGTIYEVNGGEHCEYTGDAAA